MKLLIKFLLIFLVLPLSLFSQELTTAHFPLQESVHSHSFFGEKGSNSDIFTRQVLLGTGFGAAGGYLGGLIVAGSTTDKSWGGLIKVLLGAYLGANIGVMVGVNIPKPETTVGTYLMGFTGSVVGGIVTSNVVLPLIKEAPFGLDYVALFVGSAVTGAFAANYWLPNSSSSSIALLSKPTSIILVQADRTSYHPGLSLVKISFH